MKNIVFVVLILTGLFSKAHGQENENLSVYESWNYYKNSLNTLRDHLYSDAFTQLNKRSAVIGQLITKEDWLSRQSEVQQKLEKIVGEFPQKTPLNAVVTGKIKRDGYTVEKLYFESRPGYYVTAALYLPNGKEKKPAVIYCCGHSIDGFRNATYQSIILNLVKKGFAVFTFDPVGQGERIQYLSDAKISSDPCHEHSYPGTQSFISGLSPANYFIWDGIRAVDYLISRKEVDPQRIGIAGRSGGGTQSAYIAAMDNRIAAAAPEGYITTFDKLLRAIGPQDAEQNLMYFLSEGLDLGDLIEVRAPRPVMIVSTTRDYFSIQGARDAFNESKKAYAALGCPDHIMMTEDDAPHASMKKNREAVYAFFQKFLNNPGNPNEEKVDSFGNQDLLVTSTGKVYTSLMGEDLFSLNKKRSDTLSDQLQSERKSNPAFLKSVNEKIISLTGYRKPVLSEDDIFSGRYGRDGYAVEKYLVKGAGDYYIPVLSLVPNKGINKSILLLDDEGKTAAAAHGGLADQLARQGYHVVIPDLNGFGELSGDSFKEEDDSVIQGISMNIWYTGILTHKLPLAVRMEEIDIVAGFIKRLNNGSGNITGVACGILTADLLHSASVSHLFDKIALIRPLISYQSIVTERFYHPKFTTSAVAGSIGRYDMPDLLASIAPMDVLMINPVNALDQTVDAQTFDTVYRYAKDEYGRLGNSGQFTTFYNEYDIYSKVFNWIK